MIVSEAFRACKWSLREDKKMLKDTRMNLNMLNLFSPFLPVSDIICKRVAICNFFSLLNIPAGKACCAGTNVHSVKKRKISLYFTMHGYLIIVGSHAWFRSTKVGSRAQPTGLVWPRSQFWPVSASSCPISWLFMVATSIRWIIRLPIISSSGPANSILQNEFSCYGF